MEKISVLMPAYNAASYIEASVSAILAQSYQNFELLICDDCSSDNTFELLDRIDDERVKVLQNTKNKGYLRTCNALAELSDGEFITFQDADDLADEGRLLTLITALKARELSLVGSNVNYVSQQGDFIGRSFYPEQVNLAYLLQHNMPFCGSSILCTREVYQEIGLYDPAFDRIGAEDFDWIYRAAKHFKLGNVEQQLYSYRMHADSVSNITSLTVSTQLFSEHIAKKLFIERVKNPLSIGTSQFIREQQKLWEVYLATDETPLLLKKATMNSLSGGHFSNVKVLWELLFCSAPIDKKIKAISLLTLDFLLGYSLVFKLKTFYKKLFRKPN